MSLLNKILIGLVLALGVTTTYTQYKNRQYKERIDVVETNLEHYKDLSSTELSTNKVLLLTINELKNSNDSVIQQMNKVIDDNNIKYKDVTTITLVDVKIEASDTVKIKEPIHVNFEEEIIFSPLTKVTVGRIDSLTYAKLDIEIPITIIYQEGKEYKNQYKNGWWRFWHFDWKRRTVRKFDAIIENKEAKKGKIKVVEIIK